MRTLGSVGSVGVAFVIAVGLGFWIGHTVDGWLDTSPWFTFIFFFMGLAAGVLNVYRTVGRMGQGSDSDKGRV
jgi:ATP synthase protein I